MSKAIFTTKQNPTYDDLPEERYHFPRTYLNQVAAAIGDWIVYYEPRRSSGERSSSGGRSAYFATARVKEVIEDSSIPNHFYALVDSFLPFDTPVPFSEQGGYFETALRKFDGSSNMGAFRRAVRLLPDEEYDLILQAGFAHALGKAERVREEGDPVEEVLDDDWMPLQSDRPIVEQLVRRPFRDQAFATVVKSAYRDTCAMTGLKIINGKGRSEVQAAHIRPVADYGPDSLRNGLALSATMHWLFDRGLVSVDQDFSILVAVDRVPDTVHRLLTPDRRLLLPSQAGSLPHQQFLSYHREQVFKG